MMKRITVLKNRCLPWVFAGMLAALPVMAEKPSWANDGKGDKKEHKEKREKYKDERKDGDKSSRDSVRAADREHRYFFEDRHYEVVRDYFHEEYSHGRCPPGLAKKHNGCMPPGQAKKWSIGHRLPRDVIFHDVPDVLIVKIGRPPSGHRYVRVATDILLIAIGTGMVVDAIEDLGRM